MTHAEIVAYNAGVQAVLDLAERTANRLEASGQRQLHIGFAVEALRAITAERPALLLSEQASPKGASHDAR
ncbi:hypothetical protein [Lichenihabitans psoromatis]|uniref:hypothetical protein n=1 Tax=Lichenihabitans psoromatis TaxID=2528642 RepID=UPI0010384954|nr:hypothetical protein [Lichenihabitans psoromatis]